MAGLFGLRGALKKAEAQLCPFIMQGPGSWATSQGGGFPGWATALRRWVSMRRDMQILSETASLARKLKLGFENLTPHVLCG
jgi:hypothetical protein